MGPDEAVRACGGALNKAIAHSSLPPLKTGQGTTELTQVDCEGLGVIRVFQQVTGPGAYIVFLDPPPGCEASSLIDRVERGAAAVRHAFAALQKRDVRRADVSVCCEPLARDLRAAVLRLLEPSQRNAAALPLQLAGRASLSLRVAAQALQRAATVITERYTDIDSDRSSGSGYGGAARLSRRAAVAGTQAGLGIPLHPLAVLRAAVAAAVTDDVFGAIVWAAWRSRDVARPEGWRQDWMGIAKTCSLPADMYLACALAFEADAVETSGDKAELGRLRQELSDGHGIPRSEPDEEDVVAEGRDDDDDYDMV